MVVREDCPKWQWECEYIIYAGLVQGPYPLAHHHHWTLTKTFLVHPAVVLSHENPVAIVLPDQSLHILQQVIDGANPRLRLWVWVVAELSTLWKIHWDMCPTS